jgi:hypothetical protein
MLELAAMEWRGSAWLILLLHVLALSCAASLTAATALAAPMHCGTAVEPHFFQASLAIHPLLWLLKWLLHVMVLIHVKHGIFLAG